MLPDLHDIEILEFVFLQLWDAATDEQRANSLREVPEGRALIKYLTARRKIRERSRGRS